MNENRKDTRFSDFGKIECEKISPIQGVIEDISLSGMKTNFSVVSDFCMEDEYEITVRFSKTTGNPIKLLVLPVWKYDNTTENSNVRIGFSILHSLDYNEYSDYINKMEESNLMTEDWAREKLQSVLNEILSEETPCQFL